MCKLVASKFKVHNMWHLPSGGDHIVFLDILSYVTGHGKSAHFAHYFKIELLVFKGSVDLKQ